MINYDAPSASYSASTGEVSCKQIIAEKHSNKWLVHDLDAYNKCIEFSDDIDDRIKNIKSPCSCVGSDGLLAKPSTKSHATKARIRDSP